MLRKAKKIVEFYAAMNMTLVNSLFKEKASHLVNNESSSSKFRSIIW